MKNYTKSEKKFSYDKKLKKKITVAVVFVSSL